MIQFRTPTDVQVDTAKLQALVSALPTNPMGGWFDLPETYDRTELAAIQAAAAKIQATSEYLVCICRLQRTVLHLCERLDNAVKHLLIAAELPR